MITLFFRLEINLLKLLWRANFQLKKKDVLTDISGVLIGKQRDRGIMI